MLDLFSMGISLFSSEDLDRAAQAFQSVLKKSPYYRDALYNLASTYLSMGSTKDTTISQAQREASSKKVGEQMVPIAKRMVELDGYNRNSLRMLAVAFQYVGQQDSVLAYLTRAEELPFEISVTIFQATQNGHQLRGTTTGFTRPSMRRSFPRWIGPSSVFARPSGLPATLPLARRQNKGGGRS